MDFIEERYELAYERITEIEKECGKDDVIPEKAAFAFRSIATLWKKLCRVMKEKAGREATEDMYFNLLPGNYEKALENPAFAVEKLKRKTGRLLCLMAADVYGCLKYAASGNTEAVTVFLELFIEIYCLFRDAYAEVMSSAEAEKKAYADAKVSYCSFMKDNLELFMESDVEQRFEKMPGDVNPQFLYDHRNDAAFWFDRAYGAKHAECFRVLSEKGAVGEQHIICREMKTIPGFEPENKRECISFTPVQEKIFNEYRLKEEEILTEHTGKTTVFQDRS